MLDATLPPTARAAVDAELQRRRGASFHRVDALVFSPSRSLSALAVAALDRLAHGPSLALARLLAERAAAEEADLASFLLLDAAFTAPLVALGRSDVQARRDEVEAFFCAARR